MVVQNNAINVSIETKSKETSTSQIMKALIITVNNPNVIIINGNDTSLSRGRTSMLSSARTSPASAYSLIPPLTKKLGTSRVARYKAREFAIILRIMAVM